MIIRLLWTPTGTCTASISHRDIDWLNDLPAIDFNQKHIYKHTALIPSAILVYEQKHRKPYVIGEYSYEWDWSQNFDDFAKEMDEDFKKGMWLGLFSPTPVMPLSWWWEYFDNRKTDEYIAHVKTISDAMLAAGKGSYEPVNVGGLDSSAICSGVKCGKTLFIYVKNDRGISDGIKLIVPEGFTLIRSRIYSCTKGQFNVLPANKVKMNRKSIMLNLNPTEDVVLIFN